MESIRALVPLFALAVVFVLTAVRKVGNVTLPVWLIMSGGAFLVLVTGAIGPEEAFFAIDWTVILFLAGMFAVGEAMRISGYLARLSHRLFSRAGSVSSLVFLVLFGMGLLSAVLMNDTLAIIGTPLVLAFARAHHVKPRVLLLALCFAVTIGSVMSPIGNPQNLIIANSGGIPNPFWNFLRALFIPTLLNLAAAWGILRWMYPSEFHRVELVHEEPVLSDPALAVLCRASLWIILVLVAVKILAVSFGTGLDFPVTAIALLAALPILVISPRRIEIVRGIDWRTLLFFAAMFVLMRSVWDTGFLQKALSGFGPALNVPGILLPVSVLFSQLVSNVPFVLLAQPYLVSHGADSRSLLALAAGSTIAGNLFILGAASNVIVLQNAEREGETIPFAEFAKAGIPLTAVNILVYWIFLR